MMASGLGLSTCGGIGSNGPPMPTSEAGHFHWMSLKRRARLVRTIGRGLSPLMLKRPGELQVGAYVSPSRRRISVHVPKRHRMGFH